MHSATSKPRARLPLVLAVLALILTACGSASTATAIPTVAPATAARIASVTRIAALPATPVLPTATATATPTATPLPPTATPTATPTVTATPIPPTATPIPPTATIGPTPTVPGPPVPVPPVFNVNPTPAQASRSIRAVSAAAPLRMYVAGDSFAQWLGDDLTTFGQRSGVVVTSTDGHISSGLAVPSFFDWPARITAAMSAQPPPEVVVIILGANDLNGVGGYAVGTPGWMAEYGRRQAEIMDIVGKRGSQLYWVGEPIMRDPGQASAAHDVNVSALAQIATRPWVHYVDSWSLFINSNGGYAGALPDVSGRLVTVRQDDGLHLSREGTTWLATAVYTMIRRDWQLP